jgi:hypothetical protein
MEKKGKMILVGCVVVFLLICVVITGIGAAIGIPAYLEAQQVQKEKNAYNSAARQWNLTVPEYDQAKKDFGNSLDNVGTVRIDLTFALVDGDKTTVSQKASELGKEMIDLEKYLQDMKSINDDRKKIVTDLKAALEIHEGANANESSINKADKTTEDTDQLLSELDTLIALMNEEETWYDKYVAGTAETLAITTALTDLGTQVNEQMTVIQSLIEDITEQGDLSVS